MAPRIGRPQLPPDQRRSNILRIRLTDTELAQLTTLAGEQPVADWARTDLLRKRRAR